MKNFDDLIQVSIPDFYVERSGISEAYEGLLKLKIAVVCMGYIG